MQLFFLVLIVLLAAFGALAVGVIFTGNKSLQGSCGGPDANADCCQTCPEASKCEDGSDILEGIGLQESKGDHPALSQM
ncbi:MAG: hypothetical protein GY822_12500 [Deltaproteobacteria bacterium]|nr:hypothetical protein [Deltaproteobacteria bacterium]